MSESNNNIPMRITQLEEATAYEEGMYYAVAKAGSGTKKIEVTIPTLIDEIIGSANFEEKCDSSILVSDAYVEASTGINRSSDVWKASKFFRVKSYGFLYTTMATFSVPSDGGLAFFDENYSYISGVAGRLTGSAGFETRLIKVPSNAYYAKTSFRSSNASDFFMYYINKSANLYDYFYKTLDLAKSYNWEGGSLDQKGMTTGLSGYFRTGFIAVESGGELEIEVGGNTVFIFEYREAKDDRTAFYPDISTGGGKKYTADATHQLSQVTTYIRIVTSNNPVAEDADKSIIENVSIIGKALLVEPSSKAEDEKTVATSSDLTIAGYISGESGVLFASNDWSATGYIKLKNNKSFLVTNATFASSNIGGLAFYDANKDFVSGIKGRTTGTASYETIIADVPEGAEYVRFSFRNSDKSNFFAKYDDYYILNDKIENMDFQEKSDFGIQMFKKIGVIGDSIACGWLLDKQGNRARRNLNISWVQQMARRIGCDAYNLGASGVDPIEWFQTNYEYYEFCYPYYQSTGFCDLYIIGLGLNQGTLGTISDINENDYTQNGSTFYGQYARIIQMINAEHPNAIVMCLTEPTPSISSYDQAVRNICGLNYINAELVDLENDYYDLFNTAEINAQHQPDGLHFTPYGYSLIAEAMVEALNDYISKNASKFKYVGLETT